eukprot:IDg14157t1
MSCMTVATPFLVDINWVVTKFLRSSMIIVPRRLVTNFTHVCERRASEIGRATRILFEVGAYFALLLMFHLLLVYYSQMFSLMEIFVLELHYHI